MTDEEFDAHVNTACRFWPFWLWITAWGVVSWKTDGHIACGVLCVLGVLGYDHWVQTRLAGERRAFRREMGWDDDAR